MAGTDRVLDTRAAKNRVIVPPKKKRYFEPYLPYNLYDIDPPASVPDSPESSPSASVLDPTTEPMSQYDQLKAQIEALTNLTTEMSQARKLEAETYELRLNDEAEKNARKLQTMEERLNAAQGFSIHAENEFIPGNIKDELPNKLALSDLPIFQGNDSPITHIRAFKGQMGIKGVNPKHWAMLFPYSLAAVPKGWFYSLHPTKTEKWEDIAVEFITQYRDNEDTQVSMRTLETLTQRDNEGFSEYLVRWKSVSSQIANKPSEEELVMKFIKNLRPIYQGQLRYSNIQDFKQLTRVGTLMVDDIRAGIMTKFVGLGYQGSTSRATPKHEETNFISALDALAPASSSSAGPKKKREFAPLYMTHTEAFNRLVDV
ncbi:hypothetical protein vseg_008037 [Gypsophila vaccaria]